MNLLTAKGRLPLAFLPLTFCRLVSILLVVEMQHKSSHENTASVKLTFVVLSDAKKPSRTFKATRLQILLLVLFIIVIIGGISVTAMIHTPLGKLIMPEYFSTRAEQLEKVQTLESKVENVQNQLSYLTAYNSKLRSILGDTMNVDTSGSGFTGSEEIAVNRDNTQHQSQQEAAEQAAPLPNQEGAMTSDKQETGKENVPGVNYSSIQQNQSVDIYTQSSYDAGPEGADRSIFPLLMPVAGFITRSVDYSIQHYGLDISAPEGESIVAPAPGEVVFEDWTLTGGNTLIIAHPNNFMTVYKHCERMLVSIGTKVSRGEPVALVGSTGITSTGPHLHFELWQNGKNLNPENYLLTRY